MSEPTSSPTRKTLKAAPVAALAAAGCDLLMGAAGLSPVEGPGDAAWLGAHLLTAHLAIAFAGAVEREGLGSLSRRWASSPRFCRFRVRPGRSAQTCC